MEKEGPGMGSWQENLPSKSTREKGAAEIQQYNKEFQIQ